MSECLSYRKGSEEKIGKYFKASEFDCRCSSCSYTFIHPDLVTRLDRLRDLLGARVILTEPYRCDYRQGEIREMDRKRIAAGLKPRTVAGRSSHQDGIAVDLRSDNRSGADLAIFAAEAGFFAIGVGPDWIHVDLRGSFPWKPDYRKQRRWSY